MKKIWAIAQKEIYLTFTDRNLLVVMIITPLILSTIIGFAFGGGGDTGGIRNIPLAIVNQDIGVAGENYGERLMGILTGDTRPVAESSNACSSLLNDDNSDTGRMTLDELLDAQILTDPEAARRAVDIGEYAVAIIIPSDFTERLTPDVGPVALANSDSPIRGTQIEVYANSGNPVSGSVVRSVVESISNSFVTGNIAIAATIQTLTQTPTLLPRLLNAPEAAFDDFACGFLPDLQTIQIAQVPLTQTQTLSAFGQIIVRIGSAQAVFIAVFTGIFGILSIFDERNDWTLQRLLISPTSRAVVLGGKIVGNLATTLLQMVLLMSAMMIIVSLVEGRLVFIWGTNALAIAVVVLAIVLCVSGIGVLVNGLAKTREQAQLFGPLINMGLGIGGGSFGFTVPFIIAQFSLIFWASDALFRLSNNDGDIARHIVVLLSQGAVMFGIGLYFFNKRVTV